MIIRSAPIRLACSCRSHHEQFSCIRDPSYEQFTLENQVGFAVAIALMSLAVIVMSLHKQKDVEEQSLQLRFCDRFPASSTLYSYDPL